ncbi:MAG: hypothetical protein HY291_13250 [Planctomycetes bacterium]|nr:hypothetical protein [Planctomycetota bacterium]
MTPSSLSLVLLLALGLGALHAGPALFAAENAGGGSGIAGAGAKGNVLIPEDRRIEWKPGIPGGIPKYPPFASVKDPPYGAKGDGKADDTAAIQKAIDACPPGKAVLIPAGTYRLTGVLKLMKGIALRGEGPEKSKLLNEADKDHLIGMCDWDQDATAKILSGYTRGSTQITVDNAAKLKVGELLLIDQLNDPELVNINGEEGLCNYAGREDGKRAMGQLVQIAAKNGTTLTLSRPLYYTFKEEFKPEATRSTDKAIVGAGVEDLYLEMTRKRTDESSTIKVWQGVHCWVKNVESSRGWMFGHVTFRRSLGCEVRDSFFHHGLGYQAGQAYGVIVGGQSTDILVENCLFYSLKAGMMLGTCGPGNVFAYNFGTGMVGSDYPKTQWAYAEVSTHAPHPYMNLFEGNYFSTACFDFIHGSSSHNTVFRNYADMDNRGPDGRAMGANENAMRIDKGNYYENFVGNVFGHEGIKAVLEAGAKPNFDQRYVWCLGYPDDPKVAQTILRHGNFDFVSKQIQWDPNITVRKLPNSLYLTAKPAFFDKTPWPAIGPDVNPMVTSIPARDRFLKIPKAEREAQDLEYLGEYLIDLGKKPDATAALQQVLTKYPQSPWAQKAKAVLEQMK